MDPFLTEEPFLLGIHPQASEFSRGTTNGTFKASKFLHFFLTVHLYFIISCDKLGLSSLICIYFTNGCDEPDCAEMFFSVRSRRTTKGVQQEKWTDSSTSSSTTRSRSNTLQQHDNHAEVFSHHGLAKRADRRRRGETRLLLSVSCHLKQLHPLEAVFS